MSIIRSTIVAFSNDGREIACGGRDGVVRIWNWTTDQQPFEQSLHRDRIRALRFSADDQEIISIGEDRRLVRYRHNTGQVVSDRVISTGRLLSMTFIDDESLAVAVQTIRFEFWISRVAKSATSLPDMKARSR